MEKAISENDLLMLELNASLYYFRIFENKVDIC